jgi:hypothetical protein
MQLANLRQQAEDPHAAIRQGKARTGVAEKLAIQAKEGAIPIISDVPGFKAVVYAPDDTVMAISIFDTFEAAVESDRRGLRWASYGCGWPSDRAYIGIYGDSPFSHAERSR